MKPFKCSIYSVILVAVLIGSGSGDIGGGDIGTPTTETRQCRIETGRPSRMKIVEELHQVLFRCLDQAISNFSQFSLIRDIEGSRLYFKDFCQRLPRVKDCLAVESRNWENCYNDTLNTVYSIFVDVVETSLNKGCSNEGENLAIIFDGFKRYLADLRARYVVVTECFINGINRWTTVQKSNGAIPTKIVLTHKEIQKLMDCLIENIYGDDALLSVVQDQLNETIETMNCIHPTDGSIVLCKTIDDALIDRASVCPLSTASDISVPSSLILEGRATSCFIQYEDPYTPKLSEATTIEEFQGYFRNYCRRQGRVQHCFNETTMAAGVCLHDAQYKDYKLVADYLNNVLNSACFEEGKRVATMFYTGKTLKNSTTQHDALMACLATFKSTGTQQIYDVPARIYAYYQALPAVRICLTDNMQDGTFVDDVNSFINDLMKKMKCVNPKDGAKVLCETLDQQ